MAERPTFSPFWHRVRALKPRLRPHVQITRQHYRGKRWHIVHDPTSNQFYRLNPIAHEFVGLLDGHRTVEEVWTIAMERHGDDAPTQQEALQLIGQLYSSNLLTVDATPETEQLLRRGRERLKKKAIGQAIGIMYFRFRVFNPDGILTWLEPIMRPLLNRWGFMAWLAFVIFAITSILPHFGELSNSFENALAPANYGWMAVVFIVTKAIHETGHGVILKRFGGQVPELGFMLLVMVPAPYVDASSAWALDSKWKRIAVSGGGMIFELFVASIAALVWINTASGSLTHQLAYNAMFIASVSTVLFNANPLMRFDGYFIFSDLIEMPNLMQRSQNMLKYLFKRYIYRLENETPPTSNRTERTILLVYGVAAIAYRIFLFFSITLYVMGKMFAIGLILAIWTAGMWFVMPVGKYVHWVASHASLAEHRVRAMATSIAMIGGVILLVGAVPMPDHRRASGVVESLARSGVYFAADGFVTIAHVRPGDRVAKGDPIVTMDNPELDAQLAQTRAEITRLESLVRQATVEQPVAVESLARQLEGLREQHRYWSDKMAHMVIRSPQDGVIVGADPAGLVGAFVREGEPVCEVVDDQRLRVVASLGQHENDWAIALREGTIPVTIDMRLVSAVPTEIRGDFDELIEAGQARLAHASLGFAGGGTIQTQADDRTGTMARSKQFVMYLTLRDGGDGVWSGAPGERVKVRFTLPSKPLLVQWADRIAKLVQGRVNL